MRYGLGLAVLLGLTLCKGGGADDLQGRKRVETNLSGGSAADVLNLRAAPGETQGEGSHSASPTQLEITCLDDSGKRYDSRDAGYRECLNRKRK